MPCERSQRKDDLLACAGIRCPDEQAPAWKSSPHGTAREPDRGVYEDANGWLCSDEELVSQRGYASWWSRRSIFVGCYSQEGGRPRKRWSAPPNTCTNAQCYSAQSSWGGSPEP